MPQVEQLLDFTADILPMVSLDRTSDDGNKPLVGKHDFATATAAARVCFARTEMPVVDIDKNTILKIRRRNFGEGLNVVRQSSCCRLEPLHHSLDRVQRCRCTTGVAQPVPLQDSPAT